MKTRYLIAALVAFAAPAMTVALSAPAMAGPVYTGLEGNVAISGYDAVSYFEDKGKPVAGSDAHKVEYQDSVYLFATAENAAKFRADPAKYAPQYGGHCAWAMARGYLAPGDAQQYRIVDGKLYLNFNAEVKSVWVKDIPGYVNKGDGNWPTFPDDVKFGG